MVRLAAARPCKGSSGTEVLTEDRLDLSISNSPRDINLKELAALFGVSISTMSEILRKAQRKLMAERFEDRRPSAISQTIRDSL